MPFWLQFILVFIASFIGDICWTKYMIHVGLKHPILAANWSAAILLVGGFANISYNSNHWLIVACFLGSWIGTYITVIKERRKLSVPDEKLTSELMEE